MLLILMVVSKEKDALNADVNTKNKVLLPHHFPKFQPIEVQRGSIGISLSVHPDHDCIWLGHGQRWVEMTSIVLEMG